MIHVGEGERSIDLTEIEEELNTLDFIDVNLAKMSKLLKGVVLKIWYKADFGLNFGIGVCLSLINLVFSTHTFFTTRALFHQKSCFFLFRISRSA